MKNNQPIAVFDSGMGGISVLKELIRILPNENYLFFGDSANAPYVIKPPETVCSLTENAFRYFREREAKALLIACNTATSAAAEKLRRENPDFPIVGIEPALKPAALSAFHPRILVMATPMTIQGEKMRLLAERFREKAEITLLPCPGLMDFVERGELESPELDAYLSLLLSPYRGKIDAVVTGCTHYPFVKEPIRRAIGGNVSFFDGGEGAAREMKRRLTDAGLLSDRTETGTIEYRNSREDPRERELFERLLNL